MIDITPMTPQTPSYLPINGADPKPWWQSTTVLGSLAVVLSQAAGLAGIHLDAGQLLEIGTSLVGLAGGLVAIWGRVRAAQPIRR